MIEGYTTLTVKYKRKSVPVLFYDVHATTEAPLLCGAVCQQLGHKQRIYNIGRYPELNATTGTPLRTNSLQDWPMVKPVVHSPSKQPKALESKIVDKLAEMELDGHITKATEPTDWVISMVIVPHT